VAENKNKIWLDLGFGLSLFLGVGLNVGLVYGQSSSPSYKAVDFLNSEASLSSSGSYKLNDSIDYYGGVHQSSSYHECTGDFAVLGNCGGTVTPPPPPPSSGPGGAGTTSTVLDCSKTLGGCTTTTTPTEPTVEKPPFKLPDIKEPVASAEPIQPVKTTTPAKYVKPVTVIKPAEISTGTPILPEIKPAAIEQWVSDVKPVAAEVSCEELTCTQTAVVRPAAAEKNNLQKQNPAACTIYVYGGFEVASPCDVTVFVWMLAVLGSLYVLPVQIIGGIRGIRRELKILKRRKK
jgi:hypothetical protein